MEGLDSLFYLLIGISTVFAILDWQKGIYLALLIDVLRDPIRKMDLHESIGITLSGTVVWGGVVFGAWLQNGGKLPLLFRVYPSLNRMILLLGAAMIPGAALSVLLYSSGWLLALIGAFSYLAPFAGLLVGVFFLREERAIRRLLGFFVIVNAGALGFSLAEWQGYTWEVLGGLKGMVWLRYRTGYTVSLVSGIYRSPDIMGLHAAYVVMFSIFSALHPSSKLKAGWWGLAVWAGTSLLLCGRRKMIGIPIVFICAWMLLEWAFSTNRKLRFGVPLILLTVASVIGIVVVSMTIDVSSDYADYAMTTITEGGDRLQRGTLNSVLGTLQTSGILGNGLGTCTQGKYYLGNIGARSWQEDGVSRLFVELGVPGVLLLLLALAAFFKSFLRSFRLINPSRSVFLTQTGLWAMFLACAASYVVAHQHYSGDPGMALFSVMLGGMALGLPFWTYLGAISERHSRDESRALPTKI